MGRDPNDDRDDVDHGFDDADIDIDIDDDDDGGGEVGEWLDGPRATGLPVRDTVQRVTDPRARVPTEAVRRFNHEVREHVKGDAAL